MDWLNMSFQVSSSYVKFYNHINAGLSSLGVPRHTGRSVNPISTRGNRLCPLNYYWHTKIFRPSDGPGMTSVRFNSFMNGSDVSFQFTTSWTLSLMNWFLYLGFLYFYTNSSHCEPSRLAASCRACFDFFRQVRRRLYRSCDLVRFSISRRHSSEKTIIWLGS